MFLSGSQPIESNDVGTIGDLIDPPSITDAIASFKAEHGEDISSSYFDQYGIYWVDELPNCSIDWFVDHLWISQELAEKWLNHIVGICRKYEEDLASAKLT
jgi:hypothetical protein